PVPWNRHLRGPLLEPRCDERVRAWSRRAQRRNRVDSCRPAVARGHRSAAVAPDQLPLQLQRNDRRQSDQPLADASWTARTDELPEPVRLRRSFLTVVELRVRAPRPEDWRVFHALAQYSGMADSAWVHRTDSRSKRHHSEGRLENTQPTAAVPRLHEI